jgi:transposase-like protein
MRHRNSYSDAFIRNALEILRTRHATIRATARRLGIDERILRRWWHKEQERRGKVGDGRHERYSGRRPDADS